MTESKETFSPDLLGHITALNNIMSKTAGVPGETFRGIGNLFYDHAIDTPTNAPPVPRKADKRIFFATALANRQSLLEVGFNAGHSALLALMSQPDLVYTGVDICKMAYTVPCAEYLASVFKGRFKLIKGDSRDVLPRLATHHTNTTFDAVHIDGSHEEAPCRSDIANALRLTRTNAVIIIDDLNMAPVAKVYREFVDLGRLKQASIKGFEEHTTQALAIAVPDRLCAIQPTTTNESRGILLVASGAPYLVEAETAVASIRENNPDIPIVLFSDTPEKAAATCAIEAASVEVRALDSASGSFRDKMQGMRQTPFDRTLYLDCDIIITDDLSELFDALDHFELLAAMAPGHFYAEWEKSILPKCIPQLNSGVIAYRLQSEHHAFFDTWARLHKRAEMAFDQPSFRVALLENRIRFGVLPPEYNFRADFPQYARSKVKIFHSHRLTEDPALAKTVIHGVNKDDGPRVWNGLGSPSKIKSD